MKRKSGPISDAEEARIQGMIARDPDAPEMTDAQAAQARPASEALDPALFANLTRRGRPKSEASKVLVTLRLPPAVVEGYRATGPGWQVRMGEVLEAGLEPESAEAEAERLDKEARTAARASSAVATMAALASGEDLKRTLEKEGVQLRRRSWPRDASSDAAPPRRKPGAV